MEVIVRVDGEGIRSASMDVSDVMAAEDWGTFVGDEGPQFESGRKTLVPISATRARLLFRRPCSPVLDRCSSSSSRCCWVAWDYRAIVIRMAK
jgi:hypothetical protein